MDGGRRSQSLLPLADLWPDSDPSVLAQVPEHEELRAVVRAAISQHAPLEAARAALEGPAPLSLPSALWRVLTVDIGVAGIAVETELGGSGFGMRELGVVLEESGAGLVGDPVLATAALGVSALGLADSPTDFASDLAATQRGELVVSFWPGRGSARVEVSRSGGQIHASGRMAEVLQGQQADKVIVPAKGSAGPFVALVDVRGAHVEARATLDPSRFIADIRLDEAPSVVVASPRRFREVWERLETLQRIALTAEQTGSVSRLLDLTVEHVSRREQFGAPIGSFQAIQHRLADMLVHRERCLSASRYAASLYDLGSTSSAVAAAVAAATCAESFVAVAHEALQLHGAVGFTWEHWAHLYVRRSLGDEGLFGSARDHRAALARHLQLT